MRKNTIGLQRTAFACALVASGLALTACGGGDGGAGAAHHMKEFLNNEFRY